MLEYNDRIIELAETLLRDGRVDMVIGFRKGTVPMMNEPCFIKNPEDSRLLVWDSNCGINLANYLTDRKEKIGIIAKGCDSRNIVVHIVENKIQREQLHIIGVPCKGMIDRRKITAMFDGEILEVSENAEAISVKGDGFEASVKKADVLQENCSICVHRHPVIYDDLLAEKVNEQTGLDRYEDVQSIEAMSAREKWEYFENLISNCIRCYACRNACPLCYCPTCFVDEAQPQWVGKSIDPTDTMTFHFLRAYHCAGRCTDCGACERVCPVDIPVRQFTSKLNKDAFEFFKWEAGIRSDQRPPLDVYKIDDYNDFIR